MFTRNKFLSVLTISALILGMTNKGFAADLYKFNTVNMDNSANFLILSSDKDLSTLELTQHELTAPNRLFVDVKNASLTTPKQSFLIKNNHFQNIKVAQFSNHPKTVRIVFTADDRYSLDKIRVLKNKNALVFKLGEPLVHNNYFSTIYSDDKWINTAQENSNKTVIVKEIEDSTATQMPDCNDFSVNNKYSITSAEVKSGHLIINGIGVLSTRQPFTLNNPPRKIFEILDAKIPKEMNNRTYRLNATDSVKIGQYGENKVRIVVNSPYPQKYRNIITPDLQNFVVVDKKDIGALNFDNKATISNVKSFKNADKTRTLEISASKPIYHSINRMPGKVELNLYNVSSPATDVLKDIPHSAQPSCSSDSDETTFSIPLEQSAKVKYVLSLDGRTIRITYSEPNLTPAPAVQRAYTRKRPTVIPSQEPTTGLIGLVRVPAARGKTVVLDPGHGGVDVGATRDGIYEKDITLAVARRIKRHLAAAGVNVVMTRDCDDTVSLKARTDLSNRVNSNLFVSVHVNSATSPQATGLETHWFKMEGLTLARIAHQNMVKAINSPDRGIMKSNFYVIKHTNAPSILMEIGFISNDGERHGLLDDTRQENTARSITNGILLYFGETNGNK